MTEWLEARGVVVAASVAKLATLLPVLAIATLHRSVASLESAPGSSSSRASWSLVLSGTTVVVVGPTTSWLTLIVLDELVALSILHGRSILLQPKKVEIRDQNLP